MGYYMEVGISNIVASPLYHQGDWEIFKGDSKVGVRKITKMIWGFPIEVGGELLIWELVILKELLLI